MSKNSKKSPTKNDVEQFDIAFPMLLSLLDEIKELSKKKQDGLLNAYKVKMINKLLEKFLNILRNEPTKEYLNLLDEEVLPSNSDAVLTLVQFRSALVQFKNKHQKVEGEMDFEFNTKTYVWRTDD